MTATPNVLVIVTDQHRCDTIGAYGSRVCRTPALDALAEHGAVFHQAYTTSPVCTPARASLHTGLFPFHHGLDNNSYGMGTRLHELPDKPHLLSRRLAERGYACAFTGKWHLGGGKRDGDQRIWPAEWRVAQALPSTRGFVGDDFPGHGNGGFEYPQYRQYLADRGLRIEFANVQENKDYPRGHVHTIWGEITSPVESTVEYFLANRAIHWLDYLRAGQQPWLLMLNFWGPHAPFFAPTVYLDEYRQRSLEPWPSFAETPTNKPKLQGLWRLRGQPWSFFEQALRHYYALTTFTDAQIGRVLDHLRQTGLFDDTLIIFTADHGDSQGCHGGIENKSTHCYEETVRIPLIVKPPGPPAARREVAAFAGLCDVYSTILSAAGAPRDVAELDGRSLLPVLAGEVPADWPDCAVTEGNGIHPVLQTQRMIRRGDWKYVFNAGDVDELYDLARDPHELRNLAVEPGHAVHLRELREAMSAWMQAHGDPVRPWFRHLAGMD